jgi:hypothetical protein
MALGNQRSCIGLKDERAQKRGQSDEVENICCLLNCSLFLQSSPRLPPTDDNSKRGRNGRTEKHIGQEVPLDVFRGSEVVDLHSETRRVSRLILELTPSPRIHPDLALIRRTIRPLVPQWDRGVKIHCNCATVQNKSTEFMAYG